MKFIKRLFFTIFLFAAFAGTAFVITQAPAWVTDHKVAQSKKVKHFDPKIYEGWALAYTALKRENNILYSNAKDIKDYEVLIKTQQYPQQTLPDLLTEYGISVQKDYASDFIFNRQKDKLISFYDQEASILLEATSNFRPSTKDVNANDAMVAKALKEYTVLIDKLNSSTSSVTLSQTQDGPLGQKINKEVGKDTFTSPLAYGQVATTYLETNLNRFKGSFSEYLKKPDPTDKLARRVKDLMQIQ